MECAKAWLSVTSPRLPPEAEALIATHSDVSHLVEWTSEPEVRLAVDDRGGETRNTDLLVRGKDRIGDFRLAVEAKADEPFSELVGDAFVAALERRLKNPRSRGVERVVDLVTTLLGPGSKENVRVGALRYQLFTAVVGALRTGADEGIDRVILLIHEFKTKRTTDEKHRVNTGDLASFIARLTKREVLEVAPGRLLGPFRVPGAPLLFVTPRLYVGRAVRDLRGEAA